MECLTDEILLMIFKHLHTDEITVISQVNKRFCNVARDVSLYRTLSFKNKLLLSAKYIHTLMHRYKEQMLSLSLMECFWIPSNSLKLALESCCNLRELYLTGSNLQFSALELIINNNPYLTKLAWSVPDKYSLVPLIHPTTGLPTQTYHQTQKMFKRLTSIMLRFNSLPSFEHFLPIFDSNEILVNELGLEYFSDHSSCFNTIGNSYFLYIKSEEKFLVRLRDAVIVNRYLHFNLIVMDFIIQTVREAADTGSLTALIAPGTSNSFCWNYIKSVFKTISFKKIDLSYCILGKEQMAWLSNLKQLKHLNLSNVSLFKLNLMKVVALNNPMLVSLNLSSCHDWIEKDLHGLEALALHCRHLKELNLSSLHIHSVNTDVNKLCQTVSKIKTLKALAIPACGLVNNMFPNTDDKNETLHRMSTSKSVSSLVLTTGFSPHCTPSKLLKLETSESGSYYTRNTRLSLEDENLVCQSGCGLDFIVEYCVQIEELEVVDTGFNSAFGGMNSQKDQYFCPPTFYLKDKVFFSICKLQSLRKLTLAGLSGVGMFSSLCQITGSCCLLEELSIAHCGQSGHSGSLSSLRQAVLNCKRLKKFRLDQPYFHLKENILEAFHSCKNLQLLCLISKNGKIPKKVEHYVNLFYQCQNLVGFFLFSGASASDSKKIHTELNHLFGKARRSSCITVLSYLNSLTEEGLKKVPYIYLRDVIKFESYVASCKTQTIP
ncbi:F-box/LRR-repeat protein 18 [Hydra vulgaris]|uniref:F-box/LRR-repeat protein 18 n=1 Tax=Hydra vulgaris TaxID=6087 RepID=A0ABM4BCX3_HYDVU